MKDVMSLGAASPLSGRMIRTARRLAGAAGGGAAAEFAIVVPVLLIILFGITAFASTLFIQNNMVNAAREAARHLAVDNTASFDGGDVVCGSAEAQVVNSAESVACDYLAFWGAQFTILVQSACPTDPKATVLISTPAPGAAVMDVFGFFEGKALQAAITMRRESGCGGGAGVDS